MSEVKIIEFSISRKKPIKITFIFNKFLYQHITNL